MAVQAQHLAHAFRHDHRNIIRPTTTTLEDATGASSSVFLGDPADHLLLAQLQLRGNTVFSDPRSELTSRNNTNGGFVPRKRARVGDVDAGACARLIMEGHMHGGASLLPPVPVPQAFAGDVQSREHGSGAASTSGRPAASSPGLVSRLHRHAVEIDALVRVESERLRAGLADARRRHARAVVSALERAAEADLERALQRTAELEERLRHVAAEGEAWRGVATGHEAAAAGLRATIEQLMQPPASRAEGEQAGAVAEDARSCCFVEQEDGDRGGSSSRACKACGGADACVLVLPCRHLCLCAGCDTAADACPVCAATKNASLHVLLD